MSDRELFKQANLVERLLPAASAALAKKRQHRHREQLDELLYAFSNRPRPQKRFKPQARNGRADRSRSRFEGHRAAKQG